MGLGLTMAGGNDALHQLLAQRRAERLAAEQRQFNNQRLLGADARAQQALDLQSQYRQDALKEQQRQHTLQDEARNIGLANTLADQLPSGTFLPQNDPAVGMLRTGGRGSLLTETPATQPMGAAFEGPMPGGETPQQAQVGRSAGFLKTASQKQRDTDADNARQSAVADANASARVQQLEQAAERLRQQGQLNEANILLAQARAEAESAKADAARAKASPGPSTFATEHNARSLETARSLEKKVSNWTAGAGSILANIPATDARNFKAELDTLKANIGFGELTAMREASKTGGALGQVSDRELTLLSSALGALDTGQSPANLRANLKKIGDSLQRWHDAQALNGAPGSNVNVAPTGKPSAADLIRKYGG